MYKQETDIEQFARNITQYKWLITVLFVASAITLSVIGFNKQKQYISYATLVVDKEKLIAQQVGTDVSRNETTIMDKASGILFSRNVVNGLALRNNLIEGDVDSTDEEAAINLLKKKIKFRINDDSYIQIGFEDTDPQLAKKSTEYLTEKFIEGAISGNAADSNNAYEFINAQVQEYHGKLKVAEEKLKVFNDRKLVAGITSKEDVNSRLEMLQTQLNDAKLQLKEAGIRRATLKSQLQDEVRVTITAGTLSEYDGRIQAMKSQLSQLRLNYHDDYPDILRIREQIQDLQRQKSAERARSQQSMSRGTVDDSVLANPTYQDMKLRVSMADSTIATLSTRVVELKRNIDEEKVKSATVTVVDNELAELNRDYDVNESFYKDLIKRREKARISRDIEIDKTYSGVKIYEKAFLPLTPDGLRFIHYILGGLVLGLTIPLGIIFLLQFFNQTVKSRDLLKDMGIPVIAQMNKVKTAADSRIESIDRITRVVLIMAAFALIGALVFLRLNGGSS